MIEELMAGLIVMVLGAAIVVLWALYVIPRARRRRELERKQRELASPEELEAYIRRLNQMASMDDLDHLEDRKEP